MNQANSSQKPAEVVEISRSQLPLSCPNTGTDPSALHPRVYIPLKKAGDRVACPYCGTEYQLQD